MQLGEAYATYKHMLTPNYKIIMGTLDTVILIWAAICRLSTQTTIKQIFRQYVCIKSCTADFVYGVQILQTSSRIDLIWGEL